MVKIANIGSKTAGALTALLALAGGAIAVLEKTSFFDKPVLEWAPEHFSISNGPANGEFVVVAAREKLRDDCDVTKFNLEVRDSNYMVHSAVPSLARFSGPASPRVDKFGYKIRIASNHVRSVAPGRATLLAQIYYKCPEGDVIVNYPEHPNLTFVIEPAK